MLFLVGWTRTRLVHMWVRVLQLSRGVGLGAGLGAGSHSGSAWLIMLAASIGFHSSRETRGQDPLDDVGWWRAIFAYPKAWVPGPLRHRGIIFSPFAFAAEGGHPEVLRWARQHDCPWDEQVCETGNGGRAPGNVNLCAAFG